ncbi:MAG: hypothetical protein NVS9B12_13990 [Vulcanimicrobiaceae bacterium]
MLAVLTRMTTFFSAADYKAAKFGLQRAIALVAQTEIIDFGCESVVVMRKVYALALAQSELLKVERKTKAADMASIAKAGEVLTEAFLEELRQ